MSFIQFLKTPSVGAWLQVRKHTSLPAEGQRIGLHILALRILRLSALARIRFNIPDAAAGACLVDRSRPSDTEVLPGIVEVVVGKRGVPLLEANDKHKAHVLVQIFRLVLLREEELRLHRNNSVNRYFYGNDRLLVDC